MSALATHKVSEFDKNLHNEQKVGEYDDTSCSSLEKKEYPKDINIKIEDDFNARFPSIHKRIIELEKFKKEQEKYIKVVSDLALIQIKDTKEIRKKKEKCKSCKLCSACIYCTIYNSILYTYTFGCIMGLICVMFDPHPYLQQHQVARAFAVCILGFYSLLGFCKITNINLSDVIYCVFFFLPVWIVFFGVWLKNNKTTEEKQTNKNERLSDIFYGICMFIFVFFGVLAKYNLNKEIEK